MLVHVWLIEDSCGDVDGRLGGLWANGRSD